MDINKIIGLIQFFKQLKIDLEEVTTEEEREQGLKVVVATYNFENKSYKTCRLFYRNIMVAESVKDRKKTESYFGEPVYWLDQHTHHWPQGSDTKDLDDLVVGEMAGGQEEFKSFLLRLINNAKTGVVQKITKEGRSQQYGYNLTNNNHLHDLVYLIQAIINSKGRQVDKKWFQPLVFNWYKYNKHAHGERTSLSPDLATNREIINQLYQTVQRATQEMKRQEAIQNKINLLEHKGQIILQGAPGTGKTYTAEEIAYQLVFDEVLSKEKTERKIQLERLEASEQYELAQFHPAYTYEDFVRGIVIENKGEQIAYTTKNKVLGALAHTAQSNLEDSQKQIEELSKEQQIEAAFKEFEEKINDDLENNNGKLALNDSVDIIMVEGDAFRYTGGNWSYEHRMKFKDLKQLALHNINTRQGINNSDFISGLARQDATYFLLMLNRFYEYFKKHATIDAEIDQIPLKKYVLVIDEINRANLPSVLGELIYALEYRGRKVESMYAMEDDKRSIVIPSNLYIIGTMNTADRSVGHIDYAIRRRFSFVDVLPNKEVVPDFAQDLFKSVSELFIKNYDAYYENPSIVLEASNYLSSDFRPEDIWVGHSYFMANDKEALQMKLDYEIKPLLKEYVKDGVLSIDAITKIHELKLNV